MNQEKIKNAKHVYDLFKDGSGKIQFKDLGQAIRALGILKSDAEIQDIIKDMKLIGNESIDQPEFISIVSKSYSLSNLDKELKETFQIFDKKQIGRISARELKFILSNLGYKLNSQDIDTLLAEEGLKEKEFLNFEDFEKLIKI